MAEVGGEVDEQGAQPVSAARDAMTFARNSHLLDTAPSRGRWLIVILIFIVTATQAQASFGPFQGPYDEPDNHGADVIASAVAIMPALAAGAVCGAVLLPADIYWEIAHPEDDFASAISATACVYPAMAVGYPIYLIVGLPLFGVQQLSHLTEEAPSEP